MPWWQGGSKSHSSDDSVIVGKPGFFSSRRNRFLTRVKKKLMQGDENEPELWRFRGNLHGSPSRVMPASPQSLPRPDSLNFTDLGSSLPLPSPRNVQNLKGGSDERETAEAVDVEVAEQFNGIRRGFSRDARTNLDHFEGRPYSKSPDRQNTKEKLSSNIKIPVSVSNAQLSSFGLSPPRNNIWPGYYPAPLGVFQVSSTPEMPHLDGNPYPSFFSQVPFDKSSSIDGSINANTCFTSPASPLAYKLSSDSSMTRYDNVITQAAVHPLPLPPMPAISSHPSPISLVGFKSEPSAINTPLQICTISPAEPQPDVIPIISEWQKGKVIGRGTFGIVHVASNRLTGALCAMKEVDILPDDPKSAECIQQLVQEIKVLSHLKHPNIVQYYGSEIIGDKFYIYLEYVHPGSINKFIHDHFGAITESVVQSFTRHILSGLAYLHSKKTIHRDIKGANLLVNASGVVKLADFGMAKHLTSQTAYLSMKGSPYWMAPELLQSPAPMDNNPEIASAVDIWSLGCTIIEMMNGKPPWSEYEGPAAMFKVLKETPPIPESLSMDGKDFLQCCFRRNPNDRATASQLLDHPFLNPIQQSNSSTPTRFSDENSLLLTNQIQIRQDDHLPRPFDVRIKNDITQGSPLRMVN